jgi:hypothetical protein
MRTYWPLEFKGLTADGMVLAKAHSALLWYTEDAQNSSTITDMI